MQDATASLPGGSKSYHPNQTLCTNICMNEHLVARYAFYLHLVPGFCCKLFIHRITKIKSNVIINSILRSSRRRRRRRYGKRVNARGHQVQFHLPTKYIMKDD